MRDPEDGEHGGLLGEKRLRSAGCPQVHYAAGVRTDLRVAAERKLDALAFRSISAGTTMTCGVTFADEEYCWGQTFGDTPVKQSRTVTATPTRVTNGPYTPSWVKISTGGWHTCAIDTAGDLWCWGNGYMGQLGNGTKADFDDYKNGGWPARGAFAPTRVIDQ